MILQRVHERLLRRAGIAEHVANAVRDELLDEGVLACAAHAVSLLRLLICGTVSIVSVRLVERERRAHGRAWTAQSSEEGNAMAESELYEKGMKIRRQVLGDEYVDKALANSDEFSADFQKMVTEWCWGAAWGRGVLSLKQRSLNNLCLLSALNRQTEFETHLRGALRTAARARRSRRRPSRSRGTRGSPRGPRP